jgi:hypothetical protein
VDSRLLSLYVGPAGAQDTRQGLANLLDELYTGEAERSTAGPAAFYRVARSALLISRFDGLVSPALARYLKWLGVAERAIAAGLTSGPMKSAASLDLAAALKELEAALEGRDAALTEMRNQMVEFAKEVEHLSSGNDAAGLQRVLARQAQVAKSLAEMQAQSGNEVGPQRIVQHLRTRMTETLQWLKGEKPPMTSAVTEPASLWGWLCLHFGGLPNRMVAWGWVSLILMALIVLLPLLRVLGV